jgi:periplasmic protein TonB
MNAAAIHHRRFRGTDPKRRAAGWGAVIAVHAFIGWALVSGTARKGLEIIKKPMEASVIQEVIIPPPPPPPPKQIEPPKPIAPKTVAPPPPYVPPPEVAAPPQTSAVAVQSVPTPPVTAPVIAPPPPPAPPAAPAGPSRQDMTVACPTQVKPEMPRKALQEGTEGVVKAQALIHDGVVKQVTILSGPRVYHAPVRDAMMQYKCVSGPGDVVATQEFVFKIE